MLYRKEGFPEEDEFVLCTVTKIQYHSVFSHLDEYERAGMIHISEIAPGRIRNIRDYVQEGKKVVCKVLQIDKEKGHIDLSLRRVSEAQKKAKLNMIKQEQKAEKIIESLAEQLDRDVKNIYNEVTDALFEHYEMLFLAFEDVVENEADLQKKGLKKELAKPLMELVRDKIKPKEVSIKGDLTATTYAGNGVEIVRKALTKGEESGAEITYSGSGVYRFVVTAPDYKEAEKRLSDSLEAVKEGMGEGKVDFQRK